MTLHIQTPAVGEQSLTPYQLAWSWAQALTCDPDNALFNWRFINDRDKAKPAIKRRGTLAAMWHEACGWNAQGYGIFATVNEMDGTGYTPDGQPIRDQSGDTLEHVAAIRAHVVDLDNLSAMANLQRAAQHNPAPAFAVQTSPGKAHVYWPVGRALMTPDTFKTTQRKLRQYFDGDRAVIDATRVLRVPGFWHHKGAPHLVTCFSLPGYGQWCSVDALAVSLAHINAVDEGGGRHPLGDPELAAPSVDWLWYALDTMPVDGLSHPEFISFLSAWKQAGWGIADHDEMFQRFLAWCETIPGAHGREHDLKHWNSITDTEIGWKSLLRQNVQLNAQFMFRGGDFSKMTVHAMQVGQAIAAPVAGPLPGTSSPILDMSRPAATVDLMLAEDCREYFKGCTFIVSESRILTPNGQMLDEKQFKGKYGGPRFVIAPTGAPSDDPYKAATRSNFWRIPSASVTRFHPDFGYGEIIDENNRVVSGERSDIVTGFNLYRKHEFEVSNDDPAPFIQHMEKLIPDVQDREHLFDYLAHNAKYPGHKIPWATVLQSTEGAGKGVVKHILMYLAGDRQSYVPNAKELAGNGSKFNAWMRHKTMIVVDEVKTDEKRELIEILKPFITEGKLDFQAKGIDQAKGDNYANWAFFSNHKDAVPISDSSRRFAIFFCAPQSKADLARLGISERYFRDFYGWLGIDSAGNLTHGRGLKAVAGWLMGRAIARGGIPMRGPVTTSEAEAVELGRGAISQVLAEAIEGNDIPGLMGGWVHTKAASQVLLEEGLRQPAPNTMRDVLDKLGYHKIAKDQRTWGNIGAGKRGTLWHKDESANRENFAFDQGIEVRGAVVSFPGQMAPR